MASKKKVYTAKDGTKHKTTSQAAAESAAKKNATEKNKSSSSSSKSSPSKTSVKVPSVNYEYDAKKESVAQYNARIAKEKSARDTALTQAQKEGAQTEYESTQVDDQFERTELESELNSSGLPDDQKDAIRALYDSISTNDKSKMQGYASALKAGLDIADPIFKAQTRVLLDELDRTLSGKEADKAYKENQLRTTLSDLRKDIESSGEFLSLDEQNEMRSLDRSFSNELVGLRDELAASGLTSSSIRSRKEEILNDSYGDLRESKTRSYRQKQESLTDKRTRGDRDTQAEIDRLTELFKADKASILASTETEVGSDALKEAGYTPTLGKLPGNIAQKKYDYADQFARSFVF